MSPRGPGTPPEIPGFTHLRAVGTGGYATVHLYEQDMPHREVAVKVVKGDVDDSHLERFRSEANLMAKVSTHPAIVSVYGAGLTEDGLAYLVMEYCPGPSLGARLRSGPLPVAEALSTAIQIAGAVETAHRAGIVHRDIKPGNILFTSYHRPALADFGISAMSGPSQDDQQLRGMSVPWAPPEQLMGTSSAEPVMDVYSLAATTYAMLAGRSPFDIPGVKSSVLDLSRRIVRDPLPALDRSDVPPSLFRVLSVAMDKKPESRYRTALTFARALQQVEIELGLPVTRIDLLQDPEDLAAGTAPSASPEEDGAATRVGVFSRIEVPVADSASGATPKTDRSSGGDSGGGPTASGGDSEAQARGADAGASSGMGQADDAPAAGAGGRWRRVGGVAAMVVVLLVVGGALLQAQWAQDARPKATFATRAPGTSDPLGEPVPPPTNVVGAVQADGVVRFTWEEPQAGWDGRYMVQLASDAASLKLVSRTQVDVPAQEGSTCVEVSSMHPDGRVSEPVTACVATP